MRGAPLSRERPAFIGGQFSLLKFARMDIVPHCRVPVVKAMLVSQTVINPLDRVMLLLRRAQIITHDLVNETSMTNQFRAPWLHRLPVTRRRRMRHHLRDSPAINRLRQIKLLDTGTPSSFTPTRETISTISVAWYFSVNYKDALHAGITPISNSNYFRDTAPALVLLNPRIRD